MPVSLLYVDPVKIAWDCLHNGFSYGLALSQEVEECARCRTMEKCVAISEVVSPNFTDWEIFKNERKGLCLKCSWALKTPELRTSNILLDKTKGTAVLVSAFETQEKLLNPLKIHEALTVPISGRKHLLVKVKWGEIVNDDASVPWSDGAASMLSSVKELRKDGVTTKALLNDYPPVSISRSTSNLAEFFAKWEIVKKWRGTPQLDIALKITQGKQVKEGEVKDD